MPRPLAACTRRVPRRPGVPRTAQILQQRDFSAAGWQRPPHAVDIDEQLVARGAGACAAAVAGGLRARRHACR